MANYSVGLYVGFSLCIGICGLSDFELMYGSMKSSFIKGGKIKKIAIFVC